ncbi:YcnI family protein [Rhodococcus sp. D2-41]|uniref:YcnI family protein n=1 Tax=Speluncibacter jeojiensis TaxID=2710754 RepID=A0A9X4M0V8_9ACTN|nr:YcnI family protein [Rhodococcus sp. D2-41]MDG3010528.1 YcnI family protein [Rhodococcus sp. D2-41]MDG3014277.1 YcnI family protein [Corynebacteriales bacterium D3-21]
MKTFLSRAFCTATAAGAVMLASVGVASAHVTVSAPGVAQGGYGVLTFKVPTESDTAGTTKLTVTLPNLKSARTKPMTGWTSVVTKDPKTDEATSVTWTADPGVMVAPGQFDEFELSAGPLPKEKSVSFPAEQTYSDGKIVSWNQPAEVDGAEPDHPAPSLTLGEGSDEHGMSAEMSRSEGDSDSSAQSAESDDTARWLGGAGLVLGALALALSIGALVRGKRS